MDTLSPARHDFAALTEVGPAGLDMSRIASQHH